MNDVVLVSWVSVNHKAEPLLTAIHDDKSPLRGRVRQVYLCWRETGTPQGERERTAFRETNDQLHGVLGSRCPSISQIAWETTASPTDHAALRPFAEQTLERVRREHPNKLIVIHLSPGTPAIHAVWLVLGSTGHVAGPLRMIQTAGPRGLQEGQPPVQFVDLDLDTWLHRYRDSRPQNTGIQDDGNLWDPAQVQSPTLKATFDALRLWAPLRVAVLLKGEPGTGKSTHANFLRAMSPYQKAQPNGWPVMNCARFRTDPTLARAALFGHAKGIFTHANQAHRGIIEHADGDTLFLDEVADIDQDSQRLILDALDGRGYQRVGELRRRTSVFRLVCATNQAQASSLNHDLFSRTHAVVVHVPPLRQCRPDLPDVWSRVLYRTVKASGVEPSGWTDFTRHPTLMAALRTHELPNNLRDLHRATYHLIAALNAGHSEDSVLSAAVSALG